MIVCSSLTSPLVEARSDGGSENTFLHVLDLTLGKETGDVIDRAELGGPTNRSRTCMMSQSTVEGRTFCGRFMD